MPVTDWIGEATRTKGRDDGFLVAMKSGVVRIGNVLHPITAGVTLWARGCPELRQAEIATLFGVRPATGGVSRSSALLASPARKPVRDWLAAPSPARRDWLADPTPKRPTPALKTRVDYQQTDRLREQFACR